MTELMDKIFIRLGLNAVEIEQSPLRGLLYMGMIYMVGMASAFFIMSLMS